jgi:hypothetical protein
MIMKLLSICKKIFFLGSAIMAIGFCHGTLVAQTRKTGQKQELPMSSSLSPPDPLGE